DEARNTEIEQLDDAFGRKEEVGRRDVPVNDARTVRSFQRRTGLHGNLDGAPPVERAAPQARLERLAFEQLHGVEEATVRSDAEIVQGNQVVVSETRDGARFRTKALDRKSTRLNSSH